MVRRGLCLALAAAAAVWAEHRAVGGAAHGQADVAHWRVPLEHAALADLELLPGVGPTLAIRLHAVCDQAESARPGDLLRVPRLGPVGRGRVMPWVVFDLPAVGAGVEPDRPAMTAGVALRAAR